MTFLLEANDMPLHAIQLEANPTSNSTIVGLITILLIVVIIVVAVSVQINKINKKKRSREFNFSKPEHNSSYDLVTNEVISLLETLQAFYKKGTDRFSDIFYHYFYESHSVYITPVDLLGKPYGRNAEKIQIELEIYNKVGDVIWRPIENEVAKPTGADKFFIFNSGDESASYTTVTTCRFNDDYRNYIIYLYYAIVKRFPELSVTCNGSHIRIEHM